MVTYFTELANARRAVPTSDLASVIANAEIDGERLADMDMLGHFVIIATAGHDTTSNAISGGLLALLQQPDQLELLRAHPELIDNAADEIVRWVAPVKQFMRNCQEPFTLRDVTFQPGDLLLLSYASASRDEEVFADPDLLDVTRANMSSHLAFGFGRHFCLGAPPRPHGDPRHLQGAARAPRSHRVGRRADLDRSRTSSRAPRASPSPTRCADDARS
jgi:cytochrome P450